MPQAYEKYLRTLNSQRQQRPELDIMSRNIRAFAEPMGEVNRNLQRALNIGNTSLGAKVLSAQRGNAQIQDMAQQQSQQAQEIGAAKTTAINDKAAEIQLKIDLEKEQKAKEKAARNTAMLRTGLQIAGMAAGAALLPAAAGVSTIAGMGMGGGAGQALGGFLGIDENGDLTTDPENFDPQQIIGGIQDIASVYSADLTQRQMKDKTSWITKNAMDYSRYLSALPDTEAGAAAALAADFALKTALANGRVEDLDALKESWKPFAVPTTGQMVTQPQMQTTTPAMATVNPDITPIQQAQEISAPEITPTTDITGTIQPPARQTATTTKAPKLSPTKPKQVASPINIKGETAINGKTVKAVNTSKGMMTKSKGIYYILKNGEWLPVIKKFLSTQDINVIDKSNRGW